MTRASVAMAVYNGESYIKEQVDSIIQMMADDDELIISYEASSDNTLEIIRDYEKRDPRVRVVFDAGHSVEENFNNAVKNCDGKYILLSDQDDVWINDKINVMVDFFERNVDCVVLISDGYETDQDLNHRGEMFAINHTTPSAIRNFIQGTYLGCQMAFRASIMDKVWPVRTKPPLPHDLWLGVKGARFGRVCLIGDKLILHRLHGNNFSATSKMSLAGVVKNRWLFLRELLSTPKRR